MKPQSASRTRTTKAVPMAFGASPAPPGEVQADDQADDVASPRGQNVADLTVGPHDFQRAQADVVGNDDEQAQANPDAGSRPLLANAERRADQREHDGSERNGKLALELHLQFPDGP